MSNPQKQDKEAGPAPASSGLGSERLFSAFMRHLPGGAWTKDLQGRYVFANERAARRAQQGLAEFLGKTDDELWPAATAAQFKRRPRAKARRSGPSSSRRLSVSTAKRWMSRAARRSSPARAGASGYLLKRAAVSELGAAIKEVVRGETYLSPSLAGRVAQWSCQGPQDPESPLEKLTPRQREILQLIAESKNTKEIALLLGLSPKTVEFHRAELMNRLGIHDVPGLVRYAMQRGLSPAES